MRALLRTRRWIAFTVLVIVAIAAFGLLSRWQWMRAEEQRAQRLQIATESALLPVSVAQAVQEGAAEWAPILIEGRYEPDSTALVRQRPLDGRNGFWVASLLAADDGTRVWVVRGWVPAGDSATAAVPAPPAPEGAVRIEGRWRVAEQSVPRTTDLPAGQVRSVDPASLEAADSGDGTGLPDHYVEAVSSVPADPGVVPLPAPAIDEGRNISYAVQWLLFAVIAIGGWLFFLRREARDESAAGQQESTWTSA